MKLETILVATDFSEHSDLAVTEATNVAKIFGARLVILHVEPEAEHAPSGAQIPGGALEGVAALIDENRKFAQASLAQQAANAKGAGIDVVTKVAVGHADDAIVAVGNELGADLIVTGTHGRTGFQRFMLGSIAEKVVRMSATNVLVTRGDTSASFSRILVPTDFSPGSEKALVLALSIAAPGATIDLFHSWQYPPGTHGLSNPAPTEGPMVPLHDSIVAHNLQRAEEWMKLHARQDVDLTFVQTHGSPSHVIQTRLDDEDRYDLICMGTHGYRGFRRFMLGSVAEATVRHASCSVLVVHADDDD